MKKTKLHKSWKLLLMVTLPLLGGAFSKSPLPSQSHSSETVLVRQSSREIPITDDYISSQIVGQVKTWKIELNNYYKQIKNKNRNDIREIFVILLKDIFNSSYQFHDKKGTLHNDYYNKFVDGLKKIIKENITAEIFNKTDTTDSIDVPKIDYLKIFEEKNKGNDLSIGNSKKHTPNEVVNTLTNSDKKTFINNFLQNLKKVLVDDLKEEPYIASGSTSSSNDKWYEKISDTNKPNSDFENGLITDENYQKILKLILTKQNSQNLMVEHLGLNTIGDNIIQKLKEQITKDETTLSTKISDSNLIKNANPYAFYYSNFFWSWIYSTESHDVFKSKWNNAFNNPQFIRVNNKHPEIILISSWTNKNELDQNSKPSLHYLLKMNNAFKKGELKTNTDISVKQATNEIKNFLQNNFKNSTSNYFYIKAESLNLPPKLISTEEILFTTKLNNMMQYFPITVDKKSITSNSNETNEVKVKVSTTIKPELKDTQTTNSSAETFEVEIILKTNKSNQEYDNKLKNFQDKANNKKTEIIDSVKKIIGSDLYNDYKNQLDDVFSKSLDQITKQKDFLNKSNDHMIDDLQTNYVNDVLKKIKENNPNSTDTVKKLTDFYSDLSSDALKKLKDNNIGSDNELYKEIEKGIDKSKNKVISQIIGTNPNLLTKTDLTLLDALSGVNNSEQFQKIISWINKVNPRILKTSFNAIKRSSYYAFTGLSGFVFLSLLLGIKAIYKIDTNRFKINKRYFLIIAIMGALLSGGGAIYLLLGLI